MIKALTTNDHFIINDRSQVVFADALTAAYLFL